VDDVLVAGRGTRANDDRHAIGKDGIERRARARECDRVARILAPQRENTTIVRENVVARAYGAGVRARDRDVRRAAVRRDVRDADPADVEEVAAHRAGEGHALAVLSIDLSRDRERDATELVARGFEHFAAPVEKPAERAARDAA
jgi:hypothetical protein